MERKKQKFKTYVLLTQSLLTLALLTIGGFFLGHFIQKDSYFLAIVLMLIGMISGFYNIYRTILLIGGDEDTKII